MSTEKNFEVNRICQILEACEVFIDKTNSAIVINGPNMSEIIGKEETTSIKKAFNEILKTYLEQTDDKKSEQFMYNLKYPVVKRGQVYKCDFGQPYGSEQGYERYAIIIQNDEGNLYSPTTIVIACTTEIKSSMVVHLEINFSRENMEDYDEEIVGTKTNTILAEQIRTVDKRRLREFVGTLKPEIMNDKIQLIIEKSLELKPKKETKPVYITKPVIIEKIKPRLNILQMKILSNINIQELAKIMENDLTNEEKCSKILKLFGFDLEKNGVQYLRKSIILSLNYEHFNLETLIKIVAENSNEKNKDEIKRLIIARVKETFKIKSCTLEFIRLINSFLMKGAN